MEAGLGVGADGKEGGAGGDAAVRISTQLFGDELLSGSPQEEHQPLIRLRWRRPRRPRVSFTRREPGL